MKILAFCFRKIPSAVIGIIKPLEVLQKQGVLSFSYMNSLEVTEEAISKADVVISIRGAEQIDLKWVNQARDQQKHVIYYMDDDLLDIDDYVYQYNRFYLQRKDIQENIEAIMRLSHTLWTSSSRIHHCYESYCNRAYVLLTPALLLEEEQIVTDEVKDYVTIGFAGGIDHRQFYESMLGEPIRQIISRYSLKVRVEIFGFQPYTLYNLPITYYPYVENYETYIETMKSLRWDIAVAPLPDTDFHRCKHYNKYLEYGTMGFAGIYSDVSPYKDVITDQENGLLVKNTVRDWFLAIQTLIDDIDLRKKIVKNAYEQIQAHYTLEQVASQIYHILESSVT